LGIPASEWPAYFRLALAAPDALLFAIVFSFSCPFEKRRNPALVDLIPFHLFSPLFLCYSHVLGLALYASWLAYVLDKDKGYPVEGHYPRPT
jgi:hypothetical protein